MLAADFIKKIKQNFITLILSGDLRIDLFDFWAIKNINQMNNYDLPSYHLKRLGLILSYANNNTVYWKELCDSLNLNTSEVIDFNEFFRIPTLTKSILQNRLKDLRPHKYGYYSHLKVSTSGSTGVPSEISIDANCLKKRLLLHRYYLVPIGSRKIRDYGHFWQIQTMHDLKIPISSHYFKNNLEDLYKFINKENIKSLGGPLSYFLILAEDVKKRGVKLNLRSIQVGSEHLLNKIRENLERVFNCPVYDKYVSAEFGHLGYECEERHGFHVNTANVFLEIVDNDGRPVDSDRIGRIVITSFDNKIMPLIRYDVGDVGRWLKGECRCGLKTPRFIFEGRYLQYLILPTGKYSIGGLSTFIDNNFFNSIKKFQFIQESELSIILKIVPTEKYKNSDDIIIIQSLSKYFGDPESLMIKIQKVSFIEDLPNGKAKLFISKL